MSDLTDAIGIIEGHLRDPDEDGMCPCSVCGQPQSADHDPTCPMAILKGLGRDGRQPHMPIPPENFSLHAILYAKGHYKEAFEATGLPTLECLRLLLSAHSGTKYVFQKFPSDLQILKLLNHAFNLHVPASLRMDAIDRLHDHGGGEGKMINLPHVAMVMEMLNAMGLVEVADAPFDAAHPLLTVEKDYLEAAVLKWADLNDGPERPRPGKKVSGVNKDKRVVDPVLSQMANAVKVEVDQSSGGVKVQLNIGDMF